MPSRIREISFRADLFPITLGDPSVHAASKETSAKVSTRAFVLEERLKIARHFSAGFLVTNQRVPAGRLMISSLRDTRFNRPAGTEERFPFYPALKRRAIIKRPIRDEKQPFAEVSKRAMKSRLSPTSAISPHSVNWVHLIIPSFSLSPTNQAPDTNSPPTG